MPWLLRHGRGNGHVRRGCGCASVAARLFGRRSWKTKTLPVLRVMQECAVDDQRLDAAKHNPENKHVETVASIHFEVLEDNGNDVHDALAKPKDRVEHESRASEDARQWSEGHDEVE